MHIIDLAAVFNELEKCCLHDPQWRPPEVIEIITGIYTDYSDGWKPIIIETTDTSDYVSWKSGTESESAFVVLLTDGNYGLLHESEDYTGHGCQCNAYTGRYKTIDDLLKDCTISCREALSSLIETCAHCGRIPVGYAHDEHDNRLCHSDTGPDCYRRVTVYKEELGILKNLDTLPWRCEDLTGS